MTAPTSREDKSYTLELAFKGDRNYLHGTDIIPALLEITGPASNLSVQIYRMTSHFLVARHVTAPQLAELRRSRELCALMSYDQPSCGQAMIAVTEDTSQKVLSSRPYDEAAVVRTATRAGDKISQGTSETGTFFERVVALNKRLLTELEGEPNWLFCGLELAQVPARSAPLSIVMTNNVGRGLYKSSIAANGAEIGSIVFARKPAN
jgi:hypothetical protein